ncbi:DUF3592 domain-containing protein [Schlesneria paludicola]|uniref:DUF3592 domain-containing protein n=1 Tax=Schlesneria paludicola TaxID=360056 RepID=UPI0002EB86D9|nr:DUF3592 domain-containing protein [Schlesneria paludicola]
MPETKSAAKTTATKKSSVVVYLLLALFGLPFAAVGILCDFQVLQSGVKDLRVQFWKETPCTIVSADLLEEPGSEAILYRVKATYRYDFAGQNHVGTRVSVWEPVDSQKSFHERIYAILDEHRAAQKPFPCFVDPHDPTQAILFKDSQFWMVAMQTWMGLLFTAIGLGLISVVVASWRDEQWTSHDSQGPAWARRADWNAGEIRHSDRRASQVLVTGAFVPLIVGLPGAIIGVRELIHGGDAWAAVGFLPLGIGLLILRSGLRRWLRWQRYGDSIFQMASVPGVVGGCLTGVVRTERSVESDEGFRIQLTCTETARTSSDSDHQATSKVLWDDEQTIVKVVPLTDSDGIAIPVQFVIPYDQPSSNDDSKHDEVKWTMTVTSISPGANYRSEFVVPVFRTDRSRRDAKPDQTAMAQYAAPVESMAWLKSAKLTVEPLPEGGHRFIFPRSRNLGFAACMMFLQAIFSLVLVVLSYLYWHAAWPYVAGLFGFNLIYAVMDLLCFRSEIDVTSDGLTVRSGAFFIGADRQFDSGMIRKFATKFAGSAGNVAAVDLFCELNDGKRVLLAKRIIPARVADELVKQLTKELALPQQPNINGD